MTGGYSMAHEHSGKLWLMLAVCIYLNLLDLLATLAICQCWGWESEFNPVMRYFFSLNSWLAILFKTAAVIFFVFVMQYAAPKHFNRVYQGTLLITSIYTALFGWHLIGSGF